MNEEIKIEKGIPIPNPTLHTNTLSKLVKSMEVGDSFVVNTYEDANRARSCANNHHMRTSARRQPDGTYRIWRKS